MFSCGPYEPQLEKEWQVMGPEGGIKEEINLEDNELSEKQKNKKGTSTSNNQNRVEISEVNGNQRDIDEHNITRV